MQERRTPRERVAGQSAMADVLAAQAGAPRRGFIARLFGVSPLTKPARLAYDDALGELLIGDLLENLGQRWDVLHDLPLPGSTIDHLVIGPAGVFAVRVENCRDRDVTLSADSLLISGENRNDLAIVTAQARSVEAVLDAAGSIPVAVEPLVVVVSPRRFTGKSFPSVVPVVDSAGLSRYLLRDDQLLDGDEVARISDLADLDTTWPAATGALPATHTLHRDFALVRAEERTARTRRLLWSALGIVVIYCAVWTAVATLVSMLVHR